MATLGQYLIEIRKTLTSTCPKALHLVMGNEACDLDSAVSAVVYAFLLNSLRKDVKRKVVPVLNIPGDDYPMKTEVTYWFNKHNIAQDHLVFRNDFDLTTSGQTSDTLLTLVDHNMLAASDKHLEPNVVSILDHHKLERPNPEKVKDGVVVEMVGSCATLVTEAILKNMPELLENTTASLLYGTIVLDTVNLSEAAKRVTKKDVEMCKRLEGYLTPSPDRTELFRELTAAKSNISHLTAEQLLRKDVKVAEGKNVKIAVASVPMSAKKYLDKPDVGSSLQQHNEKRNYDMMVVMGIVMTENSATRDMAIFSKNADLKEKIADHLNKAGEGVLQLSPFWTTIDNCLAYQQGNPAASRKVVLPFIRDWLSVNAQ